ncbi:MAG: nucleotidyltransferase family protein [Candidatus Methylacidiphilales bacterium]|nr:nucleotidyltransferase family protein [Candidatus Methylacidiphilales bacterium]
MQVLILAAGYATRLYPLTLNQPKPLLPVAGKPMLEHVIDNLAPISGITDIFIVTNNKFTTHFQNWSDEYSKTRQSLPFKTINDGTTSDADKLGAIGDIHLVVTKEGLNQDLIVVAGDNLFSQTLEDFGKFCREKNAPVLAVFDVKDLEAVKKYNSITLAEDGHITFFEEKPKNPTSTLTGIALYFFPAHILPLIDTYIKEGNNPDQPGRFIQWLYPRTPVFTWTVPGLWLDIGSKETLEEANRVFGELV